MVDIVGGFQTGLQDAERLRQQRFQRERDELAAARQDAAFTALEEQYGAIAGDPARAGQLAGISQREQAFTAQMEDRERGIYLSALQNGANMYRNAIARGASPQQAAELIGPALPRLFGNEEDAAEAAMMLASDPNAAEVLFAGLANEAIAQPEPRGSPIEVLDESGQRVLAQQIVNPDGSVTYQPVEGFRPAPPRQRPATARRQFRTLSAEEVAQLGYPEGSVIQQTSDGQLVEVRTPGADSPTERREARTMAEGRRRVNTSLRRATQLYADLERLDAVPTPEGGALQNVPAFVARGIPGGDAFLGALGREGAQRVQELEGIRPQILSAVAQATGMSSRQMDSNRELQFYLQAATNPTRDVVANYAALYALAQNFGDLDEIVNLIPEERLEEVRRRAGAIEEQAPTVDRRAALLGVTMADLEYTAEQEGISVDEVLAILEARQ